MKYKVFFIFLFVSILNLFGQVNAGGNRIICGVDTALHGTGSSGATFNWTIISKPTGASNPIFSNSTILEPTVTGMNTPGPYTFRITQNLSGQITTSDVTITSTGDVSSFSAGVGSSATIPATTGSYQLQGVIPEGFKGEWRAVNIYRSQQSGNPQVSTNSQFSNSTIANPVFSLINKANHEIDPAYKVILKITSNFNPSCFYEKEIIVRFIPNPNINIETNKSFCLSSLTTTPSLGLTSAPFISTDGLASGAAQFGTTFTINPISFPSGGNLTFKSIDNSTLYFNPINVEGIYTFTITVSNSAGSYTTPSITMNFAFNLALGFRDINLGQIESYSGGGTGASMYPPSYIGNSTPITIQFKIDPSENPNNVITTAAPSSIAPTGGYPTVVHNGTAGQPLNRNFTVTPPVGGWRAGTYAIRVGKTKTGSSCSSNQTYYIHISGGFQTDIHVNNVEACLPGAGISSVVVDLPAIKLGDSSYLQDYSLRYGIETLSKPNGASNPIINNAELNAANIKTGGKVTITNLDKPGVYTFRASAPGKDWGDERFGFIKKEFDFSNASNETIFTITVNEEVNANAGGDYITTSCAPGFPLLGNQDGGQGTWTVVSTPSGVSPSNITFSPDTTSGSPYTMVNGTSVIGAYTFRWTTNNGSCSSFDDVVVTVADNMPEPLIIINEDDESVKVSNYHPTHIYTLPAGLAIDSQGYITGFKFNQTYSVKVRPYGTNENTICFSEGSFIIKKLVQCTNPALVGTPDGYTNVGITTQTKQEVWPGNVPNGFLALESSTKGMVITRVQNSTKITEPKEGMIIYNIDAKCVQLYNGTIWNCIKNTCGSSGETPRKIRIGRFASYTIGSGQFPAYDSQLTNVSNYGPTGTFKGVTGFEFSDLSTTLASSTGSQLKSNYDIINTGYTSITSVQAQHVADFVKEGGVAIINLDTSSAYNFNPILTAFGITGSNGNGAISALSSPVNEMSNVFGDTKNINLSGAATQGRVLASQLPSTSTIYANETATGGGVAVWTIGGDFKGKVIFVWDEGIFRASSIADTVINTPQEKFVHNLMAYALVQLGFQP